MLILVYQRALREAQAMMDAGCEPTSALKQAGSDAGIQYGEDMGRFVDWAHEQMGLES